MQIGPGDCRLGLWRLDEGETRSSDVICTPSQQVLHAAAHRPGWEGFAWGGRSLIGQYSHRKPMVGTQKHTIEPPALVRDGAQ